MKTLFIGAALLVLFSLTDARPKWNELSHTYTYEQYKKDFQKTNTCLKEDAERRAIFEENLKRILTHNMDSSATYKMGVNHMTDWTASERRSVLGVRKGLLQHQVEERNRKFSRGELTVPSFPAAPHTVDWRGKGVLTAVKDQGHCGSCWSFAAAETIESQWAIATNQLNVLSEQHILSCTPDPLDCGGTGGCAGGTAELAFQSMINSGGIASEWKYPYLSWYGNNSKCRYTPEKVGPTAVLSGYQVLPSNQQQPLLQAVAYVGPIAISVDASEWHLYESGVFNGCNQVNPDINHGVQLVGYGHDTSVKLDYWVIRNSWTPTFGEDGFIRIERESVPTCGIDLTPQDGTACAGGPANVTVCGTCGVLYDSAYPIVAPF